MCSTYDAKDSFMTTRIAIVDLLFSWPPHGGADVDVYHVTQGLCAQGHDARLFFVHDPASWERGQADPAALPFPAERLLFAPGEMNEATLTARIRERLDQWQPDFVLLTQGYFFKTPLILALGAYRVISRCYAHETACHRDILRFKDGAPCPYEYRHTPEICRACALAHQRTAITQHHYNAWTQEYMGTQAWTPAYYDRFMEAMQSLYAVIVTTKQMRTQVEGLCKRIHVVPHGVDAQRFTPRTDAPPDGPPVIFAPGRLEDPAKGLDVLLAAAQLLADEGRRFTVQATVPEGRSGPDWLRALGKIPPDAMVRAYQQADIAVVPSVWDEPFGIVALEAMAAALPVCAAQVGGLQDIVVHGETGMLFERGNAPALADALRPLLDDQEARHTMGAAGRDRVLKRYQWDTVLQEHYPPLFASKRPR